MGPAAKSSDVQYSGWLKGLEDHVRDILLPPNLDHRPPPELLIVMTFPGLSSYRMIPTRDRHDLFFGGGRLVIQKMLEPTAPYASVHVYTLNRNVSPPVVESFMLRDYVNRYSPPQKPKPRFSWKR